MVFFLSTVHTTYAESLRIIEVLDARVGAVGVFNNEPWELLGVFNNEPWRWPILSMV